MRALLRAGGVDRGMGRGITAPLKNKGQSLGAFVCISLTLEIRSLSWVMSVLGGKVWPEGPHLEFLHPAGLTQV